MATNRRGGAPGVRTVAGAEQLAQPPDVQAPAVLRRHGSAWLWLIPRCPLCGSQHVHGAGPVEGDPRQFLGHRAAPCTAGAWRSYELVEAEE